MQGKFARFNEAAARLGEWIGFAALVFIMALTCVDVAGAKLFLRPVPGSLDMVMLAQLVALSCAGAITLLRGQHIAVEFMVVKLPARAQAALDCAVQALSLALFVLVVWRLFAHGAHLQAGNEVTPTAAIPMAPFAYFAALALVPLCLVIVQRLIASAARALGR
jgi:TRAP-type C4-dicarboxylate transport system permease small subunit